MTENPFEIPQTLRDVSEQNLKQVRAAYEQLMDFVNKSMDAWMGAHPMAAVFKEVQGRASRLGASAGTISWPGVKLTAFTTSSASPAIRGLKL
jgi:hypothetical protein